MDLFPEALKQEYADYLCNISTNRSLLTSCRRWEMREILNHLITPAHTLFNIDDFYSTELGRLCNLWLWTLQYFELDSNQIYRSAKTVQGVEYGRRYALCDYDSFACLTRLYRGLYYISELWLPVFTRIWAIFFLSYKNRASSDL
jgi:hypothetical protein